MSKVKEIDADNLLERLLLADLKSLSNDDVVSLFEDLGLVISILSEHKLKPQQNETFQKLLNFKHPLEVELFLRNFMIPTSDLMFDMDEESIYAHLDIMDLDGLIYTLDVWKEKSKLDVRYVDLYVMACDELNYRSMPLSGKEVLPS